MSYWMGKNQFYGIYKKVSKIQHLKYHLCVEYKWIKLVNIKNLNKLVNITKQKRLTDIENKLEITCGEESREVQDGIRH